MESSRSCSVKWVRMTPVIHPPLPTPREAPRLGHTVFLLSILLPITIAGTLFFRLDGFDPAPYPDHEIRNQTNQVPMMPPRITRWMLGTSERIGQGQVLGPEDLVYNPESGVMYAGCADGWIKRVTVNESGSDSVVEELVNTGGRPLGLALGRDNDEFVIADAD